MAEKSIPEEGATTQGELISSELIWEWRDNFPEDNPVCLKKGLVRSRQ